MTPLQLHVEVKLLQASDARTLHGEEKEPTQQDPAMDLLDPAVIGPEPDGLARRGDLLVQHAPYLRRRCVHSSGGPPTSSLRSGNRRRPTSARQKSGSDTRSRTAASHGRMFRRDW
jgi:hypothetical protein